MVYPFVCESCHVSMISSLGPAVNLYPNVNDILF